MTLKGGGDIINSDEIEIRCPGIYTNSKTKISRPCNHMFWVGSPGFDIFGKPKTLTVKCPKCKNYIAVTCRIEEKVIVRILATINKYQ